MKKNRRVVAMEARRAHNPKVAGSSPAPAISGLVGIQRESAVL